MDISVSLSLLFLLSLGSLYFFPHFIVDSVLLLLDSFDLVIAQLTTHDIFTTFSLYDYWLWSIETIYLLLCRYRLFFIFLRIIIIIIITDYLFESCVMTQRWRWQLAIGNDDDSIIIYKHQTFLSFVADRKPKTKPTNETAHMQDRSSGVCARAHARA